MVAHDVLSTGNSTQLTSCREAHERVLQACAPLERKLAPPRRCLVSSNCKPVPAPSDIVSAAPILKKSCNRLSSLNCWRLSVPRYLSCSNALRAANDFKTAACARSARMPPCDRLLHAVTMPAAIGTKSFLLIGVASLLHAKAIGTPLIRGPSRVVVMWSVEIATSCVLADSRLVTCCG